MLHGLAGKNKQRSRRGLIMKKLAGLAIALVMISMVFTMAAGVNAAEKHVKAVGTLTAIETDGTVTIDGSGYEVASSAKIIDSRGERSSLDKFQIPARVQIEFEYTKNGPVIRLIREMAQ